MANGVHLERSSEHLWLTRFMDESHPQFAYPVFMQTEPHLVPSRVRLPSFFGYQRIPPYQQTGIGTLDKVTAGYGCATTISRVDR